MISRSGREGHEPADQGRWCSQDFSFVIRQGLFAASHPALPLVKVDSQRTKEGEIPCRGRIADGAAIFVLRAISAEVLTVFDAPMHSRPFKQLLGTGFLCPKTGYQVGDLDGLFDDLPLANRLNTASDADQLGRSGQTNGGRVDRHAPELTLFDPTVFFIDRLSLRGEGCRAVAARL
jgi:hypothetical protein